MDEMKNNTMEIPDASPAAVRAMTSYMYTGKLPTTNINNIEADLLHLADKYKVAILKKACEKCLLDLMAVENTVNTLILVDRYKCSPHQRSKVLDFFRENAAAILNYGDWTTALETGNYAGLFTELFALVICKGCRAAKKKFFYNTTHKAKS